MRTVSTLLLLAMMAAPSAVAQVAPMGSEFKVNPSNGVFHWGPVATVLPSGEMIVVWHGISDQLGNADSDIIAQRLDRHGGRIGAEFMVNAWTSNLQDRAAVSSAPSGMFVVVWESSGRQHGDTGSLFGRLFDATTGSPVSAEFQINQFTRNLQWQAAVDMDASGDFVVVWTSTSQVESWGIWGRRFDRSGAPRGGEFHVNTHTPDRQREPGVATDAAGNFVVVWQSDGAQDGYLGGIFGRRFDSTGAALGGEFVVNAQTMWSQERPSIDMTPAGDFVVVWDGRDPAGAYTSIHGRTFDPAGAPLGPEFFEPYSPSIIGTSGDVRMKSSGEFTVTWMGVDGQGRGAFARAFDVQGLPLGETFVVNTYTPADQVWPVIGGNDDGRSVVVWNSQFRPGVWARVLDKATLRVTWPRNGDGVDCSDPRLRRPTIAWDPAHYEEFRVQISSRPDFRGAMRDTAMGGWIPGSSWAPPRGQWRKACRAGLAGGVFDAKLFIRVVGRDLDLSERDPEFEFVSEMIEVPIGVDLINPPMDPGQLESDGRGEIMDPRRGNGAP